MSIFAILFLITIISAFNLLYYWWFGTKLNWPWLNITKYQETSLSTIAQVNNLFKLNLSILSFVLILYSIICTFYANVIAEYNQEYSITNPFEIANFGLLQIQLNEDDKEYDISKSVASDSSEAFIFFFIVDNSRSINNKNGRTRDSLFASIIKESIIKGSIIQDRHPDLERLTHLNVGELFQIALLNSLTQYENTNSLLAIGTIGEKKIDSETEIEWQSFLSRERQTPFFEVNNRNIKEMENEIIYSNKYRRHLNKNVDFISVFDEINKQINKLPLIRKKVIITIISDFIQELNYSKINRLNHIDLWDHDVLVNLIKIPSVYTNENHSSIDQLILRIPNVYQFYLDPYKNHDDESKNKYESEYFAVENFIAPISTLSFKYIDLFYDDLHEEYRARFRIRDNIHQRKRLKISLIGKMEKNISEVVAEIKIPNSDNFSTKMNSSNNRLESGNIQIDDSFELNVRTFSSDNIQNLKLEIQASNSLTKSSFQLRFRKKLPKNIALGLYFLGNLFSSELIFVLFLSVIWLVFHYKFRKFKYEYNSDDVIFRSKGINKPEPLEKSELPKLENIKGIGKTRIELLRINKNITSIVDFVDATDNDILSALNTNSKNKLSLQQVKKMKEHSLTLLANQNRK